MEHRFELSGLQRPKSLRTAFGAGLVGLALLVSSPLAQGAQVSEEARQLQKYISIFSRQTTHALKQDDKVKQDEEGTGAGPAGAGKPPAAANGHKPFYPWCLSGRDHDRPRARPGADGRGSSCNAASILGPGLA